MPYLVVSSLSSTRLHQTRVTTLMMTYLISPAVPPVLILSLDVEHILHVKLEGLGASGPHHT